jgi:hypothetical protein
MSTELTEATVTTEIDGLGEVVLRREPLSAADIRLWPVEGSGPVRLSAPVDPETVSGDYITRFIAQHMLSPDPNFLQLQALAPESRAALINSILNWSPA